MSKVDDDKNNNDDDDEFTDIERQGVLINTKLVENLMATGHGTHRTEAVQVCPNRAKRQRVVATCAVQIHQDCAFAIRTRELQILHLVGEEERQPIAEDIHLQKGEKDARLSTTGGATHIVDEYPRARNGPLHQQKAGEENHHHQRDGAEDVGNLSISPHGAEELKDG